MVDEAAVGFSDQNMMSAVGEGAGCRLIAASARVWKCSGGCDSWKVRRAGGFDELADDERRQSTPRDPQLTACLVSP